eukprot:TRINITY_DN10545_c0_g1_i1.p1 TRINITY_DN10545_c0_g1~~TRINITY_DN10545_c0_g1_i1.p1  ORF type:complete len:467 (+),score=179.89 TRINITY_DN10545_c0_g1_i1:107-1507(+)
MQRRNSRLYNVLEVEKTATQAEITKAHRRLALKYHPDRAGQEREASEAKFKELQGAFDVLKDAQKRKIYDTFGEDGLKMLAGGPVPPSMLAGLLDPRLICTVTCTAAAMVVLVIVQLVLIAKRVQGGDASWATTFVPLWILDGFLLCLCSCLVPVIASALMQRSGDPDAQRDKAEAGPVALLLLRIVMFVAWNIMLSRGLDGHLPSGGWPVVFIPVLILEGIELIFRFSRLRRSAYDHEVDAHRAAAAELGIGEVQAKSYGHYLIGHVLSMPWRIVFVILLVLKLDESIDISWWGVGAPLFVMLGLAYAQQVVEMVLQQRSMQDSEEAPALCVPICCATLFYGVLATSVSLCLAKAEGDDVSLELAFVPAYILCALALCAVCMGGLMLSVVGAGGGGDSADAEQPLQQGRFRHSASEEGEGEAVNFGRPVGDTSRPPAEADSREVQPLLDQGAEQPTVTPKLDECD